MSASFIFLPLPLLLPLLPTVGVPLRLAPTRGPTAAHGHLCPNTTADSYNSLLQLHDE